MSIAFMSNMTIFDTEEESETKNIWKIETVLSWILKFSFVITFMYLILGNIYNLFLSWAW